MKSVGGLYNRADLAFLQGKNRRLHFGRKLASFELAHRSPLSGFRSYRLRPGQISEALFRGIAQLFPDFDRLLFRREENLAGFHSVGQMEFSLISLVIIPDLLFFDCDILGEQADMFIDNQLIQQGAVLSGEK